MDLKCLSTKQSITFDLKTASYLFSEMNFYPRKQKSFTRVAIPESGIHRLSRCDRDDENIDFTEECPDCDADRGDRRL